jgi:glycosyltransferase involved in cell wall biosynthesis
MAQPLLVCVADPARRTVGALAVDASDHADVPFRFGDEFPFVDRGIAGIHVGTTVGDLDRPGQMQFLLECRRVMSPGAILDTGPLRSETARTGLVKLARMAGLSVTAAGEADGVVSLAKPARIVNGNPPVTIAIPAYNPRFFAAALDSALAQTYANIEIVIRDDSRDDAIESIVRSRRPRVPLRYARNPSRLGVRANYVECFEQARGAFVKFLCDDDVLAPGCVARLLEAFRSVPDLSLATSRRHRIDASTAFLPDQPATMPIVDADKVISGVSLANAMLMVGLNMIGEPSTVLFRKADLEDQRPAFFNFDGAHGHGVIDMMMWTSLLLKGDAVYLLEPQSAFRIHPGQRQHDPALARRTIDSIRELQAAWLALGLHRRRPPHMLSTQPYPLQPTATGTINRCGPSSSGKNERKALVTVHRAAPGSPIPNARPPSPPASKFPCTPGRRASCPSSAGRRPAPSASAYCATECRRSPAPEWRLAAAIRPARAPARLFPGFPRRP